MINQITKDAIAFTARAHIDTPYQNKGRQPHIGMDNIGLVASVYQAVFGLIPESIPDEYPNDYNEQHDHEWLTKWLLGFCSEVPTYSLEIGDVVTFRMRPGATINHCAIYVGDGRIVHSYWGRACVESFYSPFWSGRAVMAFRMRSRKAPIKDYHGNVIYDGDTIRHPDGTEGVVDLLGTDHKKLENWKVDYGPDGHSQLSLQVGDKGQAVCVQFLN